MKKNRALEQQRERIDAIDTRLLSLFNARAKLAQEIGRIKAQTGNDVYDYNREHQILNRLMDKNQGPVPHEALEDIFQAIFTTCRSLQKRFKVAFFGPEATFTHVAALRQFGRNAEYNAVPTIRDVFSEVERRRADYGVVPVENSTEGVVNHTLDMFVDSDLIIVGEREEPISQNLLSISDSLKSVKRVYSHWQALAQCRKWLEARLPGVPVHEAASTADAAVQATLDPAVGAIASGLAAQIYHLKVLAPKIEDYPNNATRFLIIGHQPPPPTGHDKTSILLSMKDRVGALYDILTPFRRARINLTKIESRPTKKKAWQYLFFMDLIGHQSEPRVEKALMELRKKCTMLKILGSYPY